MANRFWFWSQLQSWLSGSFQHQRLNIQRYHLLRAQNTEDKINSYLNLFFLEANTKCVPKSVKLFPTINCTSLETIRLEWLNSTCKAQFKAL